MCGSQSRATRGSRYVIALWNDCMMVITCLLIERENKQSAAERSAASQEQLHTIIALIREEMRSL